MTLRASNVKIANAVRNDASVQYRDVVPAASQAGMEAVANAIFESPGRVNEFTDALVNRIAIVEGQHNVWNNPLADFKGRKIEYGNSVEEYHVNLLKVYSYDPDQDYSEGAIFRQYMPDVQSLYHSITRQDRIPLTVNHDILRRAFLDEGGLSKFVNDLMAAVSTTDEWSEFQYMTQLFKQYNDRQGYFYEKIPDPATADTDEKKTALARDFLARVRAYSSKLRFVSDLYNAAQRDVFARPEDLLIFTDPDTHALLDVYGLAGAFQLPYANTPLRIEDIPASRFPEGVKAILTTRDFFRVHDTLITNTSIDNPVGLYKTYFWHHHSIISNSLFVPAVAFTVGNQTNTEKITLAKPAAIEVKLADGTATPLKPGATVQCVATLSGGTAGNTALPGVRWEIASNVTSPATRISQEGVLHVSRTEKASSITVKGTATESTVAKSSSPIATTPAVAIWEIKAA